MSGMPRSAEWSLQAHLANDRILDLLAADHVSELYAFTLFLNPEQPDGVRRYVPLPEDRWVHQAFPPIQITPAIGAGLRENGHHLYRHCSDDRIRSVLMKIGNLETELERNQKTQDQLDKGEISLWEAANRLLPKHFAPSELDGKREGIYSRGLDKLCSLICARISRWAPRP